jgi:chromosome segregation protein
MLLKRVTLCGFKSFSDTVDFDFGPGVTCIVGPNGCGKSNVVDAFKWVLGEQSARSLRGRQMSDMIFNGSSTRKSSGVAQVDLVFDNTDRKLPVDQTEVTVTRKLYRSGESEYLLNKDVARLKDVRELFMDTGIGVDAYSVIEQGRVDQLLQSSPVDRRIIFEEAAGISKYKARKREAERKLERTQQNLLRVADVIDELEKRLRSVKLQAGKARSFKEYQARLNELRASYAMAEYHRFTEDISRVSGETQACNDRITALRTDIDRHEADESQVTLQLDALAEQINHADNEVVRAKSSLAAQEERIEASRRRSEEQQAQRGRAAERLQSETRRLDESQRELAQVQESAVDLQRQTHDLHARIADLNEQDRSLARDLTQAQAILEDEKAGIIDLLRKSAQTHNEIVRLNTHRESLVGQKGRLALRDVQIAGELESALEQKAQLDRRLREVEALIAEETRRLEEKKLEAARVHTMRQRLVDELAHSKERRSALLSRQDLLNDLQQKMDGVGAGVRKLLDESRQENHPRALDGVVGLVADLIDTDVQYAPIIEAVLGECDQCLVIADGEAFLTHPKVFADLPGRLTVLCEDRLPPVVNPRDFSGQPGYVARAIELVRFTPAHETVARHLLGKTIVVETLDDALVMARSDVFGHRFVTRRGEVLEPDGRVSLGPSGSTAGLISRKSELRDIEVQLSDIDSRIVTLTDQLNRNEAEVSHLDGVQQELRTAIYESNTARVEANAALQNIAETVQRLTNEQPLIAREVAFIEQQINEVLEKSAEGGKSLEAIERENKERERLVAEHQDRIDAVVGTRREVQEQVTQAKVSAGQLTEKRAAAAETINTLRRSIHELETSVVAAKHDIEQCEGRIADAEHAMALAREQSTLLTAEIQKLEIAAVELRKQRDDLRQNLETLTHTVKTVRSELAAEEARLHEQQMSLAQTTVRRDELVARIIDELGVNLSECYMQYEHQEQDWAKVEAEIVELRGKMERLGNVNLDAIAELEELEKRHSFLAGQRDDLTESHRQLEQLIARLNEESQERFKTAFEQIRENFRALFRKLFGGGRADIILEDPANVLDCGIEIVAQPPGKELQAISLMSGGEKSMTAIALLMSIFKTRPAPCAILDEVDAALDEANNDRFNRIIKEFVTEAQFIIITHSKRTMSIGDRLYGITMQEAGVSTRVSVQLGNANVA